MKARIKATGEIVEVKLIDQLSEEEMFVEKFGEISGRVFHITELDFDNLDSPDYWTRLEHQYAGMAMRSYVSNNVYLREIREMCKEPQEMRDLIADLSILLATTLVQKLKEKEERK